MTERPIPKPGPPPLPKPVPASDWPESHAACGHRDSRGLPCPNRAAWHGFAVRSDSTAPALTAYACPGHVGSLSSVSAVVHKLTPVCGSPETRIPDRDHACEVPWDHLLYMVG